MNTTKKSQIIEFTKIHLKSKRSSKVLFALIDTLATEVREETFKEVKDKMKHWIIDIKQWGILYAFGTEAQAEEWRKHKCKWEQSVGTKKEATKEEINTHRHHGEGWDILEDLL